MCEGATGIPDSKGGAVACPACSSDGPGGEIEVPHALAGSIWSEADERIEFHSGVLIEADCRDNRLFHVEVAKGRAGLTRPEAAALRDALNRFLERTAGARR
jgi:hypothetical protein